MMTIEETLRKAILESGKSRFQIAKETGVSQTQLCRFMQGRTLTLPTAEPLIRYFGYRLTKGKRKK